MRELQEPLVLREQRAIKVLLDRQVCLGPTVRLGELVVQDLQDPLDHWDHKGLVDLLVLQDLVVSLEQREQLVLQVVLVQ